jgi:hypothetical protein
MIHRQRLQRDSHHGCSCCLTLRRIKKCGPSASTYRLNGLDPQVEALLETFQLKFSAASAQSQPFSISDLAGEDRFDA